MTSLSAQPRRERLRVLLAGVPLMFAGLLVPARPVVASAASHVTDANGARARNADDSKSPQIAVQNDACPAGTLPDGNTCVRLVAPADDRAPLASTENTHRERSGRFTTYEQIPRTPDRPADYDRYLYPVPPAANGHTVVSGYDLDRPDEAQRRGPGLRATGHGAVDIPEARGTPVKLVNLDHQEGDAEVLYVGALFGNTVITRHTLREGGRTRDYLVLFGHLDAAAAGLVAGAHIKEGDLVGAVGDSGSPGLLHLHLETRRVREGVDLSKIPAGARLLAESVSVVCDPRNVLPLRPE